MSKTKVQPKKVWVSRDAYGDEPGDGSCEVELWATKPKKGRDQDFLGNDIPGTIRYHGARQYYEFCVEDFEAVTGVSLKPGELRRVTINVKAVK